MCFPLGLRRIWESVVVVVAISTRSQVVVSSGSLLGVLKTQFAAG